MNKFASIMCKTLLSGVTYHMLDLMDRMQRVNRLGYYDIIVAIIILSFCLVVWSLIED